RQKDEARAVVSSLRQRDADGGAFLAEERVGDLGQDAGAIACERIATACTPVLEIQEDIDALLDNFVRSLAPDVSNHSDAAGVVLELWIVQSFFGGQAHFLFPDVGRRGTTLPSFLASFSASGK